MRAAEAIRAYADMRAPGIKAAHIDVMDFVPAAFRKIYSNFYITLVTRFPVLWGFLYRTMNSATPDSMTEKIRQGIQRLSTKRLMKEIALADPDLIICTHFLPAEILASLTRDKALRCPVWVQVTDFDLHRMWVHDGMAGYFSANEEVAFRMRSQGIAPQSIHVTGIPVMPAFAQILDRAQCARELGIDPRRMTFLLMGGGAGIGKLDEMAEQLLAMNADFQLLVLAGKNEKLLHSLRSLSRRFPGRLIPQGYTTRIERLMACADVAITKPGGLTASECLAIGLPMIVHSPIPGQEERNADFLLEQGVALKASDAETLEYRIRFLIDSPAKLADMRRKAKALGHPFAARNVIDTVLRNN
ncbi:MAG: galactosyldiacylglycerol synthase [Burkholderiales bacterium RIFCSPLOWO2_02_FULL_57_36]|nr:MAG: galactosyldiacylglycerol synthase [Burkholderiales bacterium RIFCSPLOWO2_02_FULL_57_36]